MPDPTAQDQQNQMNQSQPSQEEIEKRDKEQKDRDLKKQKESGKSGQPAAPKPSTLGAKQPPKVDPLTGEVAGEATQQGERANREKRAQQEEQPFSGKGDPEREAGETSAKDIGSGLRSSVNEAGERFDNEGKLIEDKDDKKKKKDLDAKDEKDDKKHDGPGIPLRK